MLRSDPEKVRAWQRRSRSNLRRTNRLRAQSSRKIGHRASIQRAATRAKAASGWRCEAVGLLPLLRCEGQLETHHVIPRSTAPHLVTEPLNLVSLCHSCHAYVGDHPAQARAVGLHGHAGDDLAAMALLRSQDGLGAPQAASGGPALTDHYPPTPDGSEGAVP